MTSTPRRRARQEEDNTIVEQAKLVGFGVAAVVLLAVRFASWIRPTYLAAVGDLPEMLLEDMVPGPEGGALILRRAHA